MWVCKIVVMIKPPLPPFKKGGEMAESFKKRGRLQLEEVFCI